MGYWDGAKGEDLDSACEKLALFLGKLAKIESTDFVLDVGNGFSDQDICWMRNFSPKKILAINVTPLQIELGRKKILAAGYEKSIEVVLGSATKIPLEAACVDKVVALESAFHFNTREDFFAEAFRVLRPKGRLAIVDILTLPPTQKSLKTAILKWPSQFAGRAFYQLPKENIYTTDVLIGLLKSKGFINIEVSSVKKQVLEPFRLYAKNRLNEPAIKKRMNPLLWFLLWMSCNKMASENHVDYISVTAEKP